MFYSLEKRISQVHVCTSAEAFNWLVRLVTRAAGCTSSIKERFEAPTRMKAASR